MAAFTHLARVNGMPVSAAATLGYVFLGGKWGAATYGTPSGTITYSFSTVDYGTYVEQNNTVSNFNTGSDSIYRTQVAKAMQVWEDVADVSFVKIADGQQADIEIYWENIDGRDNTLGQAWVAESDTLTSISDVEIGFDSGDFLNGNFDTATFYGVAIHELGHALGLDHPDDENQLMYRFYDSNQTMLGAGDIFGVVDLYGPTQDASSPYAIGTISGETINRSSASIDLTVFSFDGDDAITTGSGADQIFAGLGDDSVKAGSGRDIIVDAFGDDTIKGEADADNIESFSGNNDLQGGSGDDALRGGIDSDKLTGGSGNDALIGDASTKTGSFWFGDDTLDGGTGNDLLSGGGGSDRFVFRPNEGNDRIAEIGFSENSGFSAIGGDFVVGQDQLDLRAFGYSNASEVLANVRKSGSNIVFEDQGTRVIIDDVAYDTVTISDFIF